MCFDWSSPYINSYFDSTDCKSLSATTPTDASVDGSPLACMKTVVVYLAAAVVQRDKSNLAAISPTLMRGLEMTGNDGQETVWIWHQDQGDQKFRLKPSEGIDEDSLPVSSELCFSHFVDTSLIEILEIKAQTGKVNWFRHRLKKEVLFSQKAPKKMPAFSILGAFPLDVCVKTDIYSFVQSNFCVFVIVLCGWRSRSLSLRHIKGLHESWSFVSGHQDVTVTLKSDLGTVSSNDKDQKSAHTNVLIKDEHTLWTNGSSSKDTWP